MDSLYLMSGTGDGARNIAVIRLIPLNLLLIYIAQNLEEFITIQKLLALGFMIFPGTSSPISKKREDYHSYKVSCHSEVYPLEATAITYLVKEEV